MKKSILTLLVLIPIVAFSQKQDSIPFAGASKIIIKNNNTAEQNYKIAAEKLLDQNYMIDKSDKEFHQLYTGSVKVYGEGVSRLMSLYVLSRDGSITIVGRTKKTEQLRLINTPQDTDNYENMVYKKNLLLKDVFGKMEAYAKSLGGKIIYSE